MKAKTAEENFIELCERCDTNKALAKHANRLCDDCYHEINQIPLPLDEYTMQPDEMTKEQVAEKSGGVSVRAVEKWIKAGKIEAQTVSRRGKDGIIRETTIIKVEAFNEFKENKGKAIKRPVIDTNESEHTELMSSSQPFGQQNALQFAQILSQVMQPRKQSLAELTGKLHLDLDEFAEVSGLAKEYLKRAITGATADGRVRNFPGKNGKTVYRTDELEMLLENLPPYTPPKPPAQTSKEQAGKK